MKVFKECPMCSAVWKSRNEFIGDCSLVINGYQANFDYLEHGLFYFTHEVDGCFSTMALKAKDFYDLSTQKKFTERKTFTDECPGHCLDKNNLEKCYTECECAFVRDLLSTLQRLKADTPANSKNIARKHTARADIAAH
jgi:hypothetical protein